MRPRLNSLISAKVRLSVLLSALALVPAGVFVLSLRAQAQNTAPAQTLTFAPVDVWESSAQTGPHIISGTMFLPFVQGGVYHVELVTNFGSISMPFNADGANQGFYVYYETPPLRKTWRLHLQRLGNNEDRSLDLPTDTFDVLTTVKVHPATSSSGRHVRAESAGLEIEGYSTFSTSGTWYVTNLSPMQGP